MLITIILLALSVSIDAFGIGITYGIKKTVIPFSTKIILFIFSLILVSISVIFGYLILKLFPKNIIDFLSSFILFCMGLMIIYESLSSGKENKSKKFSVKPLGITIEIIKNPISSDLNNSKVIEKNEAIYIALALSFDAMCVGLTCSDYGIYGLLYPLISTIFQLASLSLGSIIGGKIISYNSKYIKQWNVLSGILLIIIAIFR